MIWATCNNKWTVPLEGLLFFLEEIHSINISIIFCGEFEKIKNLRNSYCLFLSFRFALGLQERERLMILAYLIYLQCWRKQSSRRKAMSNIQFQIQQGLWIEAIYCKLHLPERRHTSNKDSKCICWTLVSEHNSWQRFLVLDISIFPKPRREDSNSNHAILQHM